MEIAKLIKVSLIKIIEVLIYITQKQEIKNQKMNKIICPKIKYIINLIFKHFLISFVFRKRFFIFFSFFIDNIVFSDKANCLNNIFKAEDII